MKKIAIFGSTGSIGTQALRVVRRFSDEFGVSALAAGSNTESLKKQVSEFQPAFCAVSRQDCRGKVCEADFPGTRFLYGEDANLTVTREADYDIALVCASGVRILPAALEAVRRGKRIALATKEVLVAAGDLFMAEVNRTGAELIPVDSEHSAVFQCLHGGRREQLSRIILTASGGPFRGYTREQLQSVTPAQALRHPNWSMGRKITVDSATMMNKGLEVIEAKWLFGLEAKQIHAVIHPQSIVHSMVEFDDGAVLAQLSYPSMELPIQLAFTYPDRAFAGLKPLDFASLGALTFEPLERGRFPCFDLALAAMEAGGILPAVLNAANEELVEAFLNGRISFAQIPYDIEDVLSAVPNKAAESFVDIEDADREARRITRKILNLHAGGDGAASR